MFSSDDFCSGEKFQQLCDVYCGVDIDLFRNPKIASETRKHVNLDRLVEPYDNPCLVFCYSRSLGLFASKLHLFRNAFVLVSHNEDQNVTDEFLTIANHPIVVKWFAQNLMIFHPKVTFLPIGVANEMWPHGNISVAKAVSDAFFNAPKSGTFFNFDIGTNPSERQPCLDILQAKGLHWTPRLPYGDYLSNLSKYKYAISPPGNGVDCHRTWEAYYMGVIPVLKRSRFTECLLADGYACVLLDRWEDFNEAKLEAEYDALLQTFKTTTIQRLRFSHFRDKILDAAASVHSLVVTYAFVGPLPSYSIDTVKQLRLFYDGPVYFILNDVHSPFVSELQGTYGVVIVPYDLVRHDHFWTVANRCSSKFAIFHGLHGRERLAFHSFERFFLLHNFMQERRLNNVLFVELDNPLYDEPRRWLPVFEKYDFACMHDNAERSSAGICFVRSTGTLRLFMQHCLDFIQNSTEFMSEMTCLGRFAEAQNSTGRFGFLPVHWPDADIPAQSSHDFGLYGDSIFDAAAIGIFIGGMDPFHTQNVIKCGLRSTWSAIDYTHYEFKWETDTKGRSIPYIRFDDKWLRINNLHIHSKDLRSVMSIKD